MFRHDVKKIIIRGNFRFFERSFGHASVTVTLTLTMSSPVIFKRTKSKPAQRTRPSSPDHDHDNGTIATDQDSPSTLATKLKNKVKKSKPKSRLSFGGDDDEVCVLSASKSYMLIGAWKEGSGEVFQVKKSSLSRKVALGRHPAYVWSNSNLQVLIGFYRNIVPANLDQASISPRSQAGPTYDKAYLNQLKASTPTSRPPLPTNDPYDADTSMDIGDISMQSVDSVETVDIFGEHVLGCRTPH